CSPACPSNRSPTAPAWCGAGLSTCPHNSVIQIGATRSYPALQTPRRLQILRRCRREVRIVVVTAEAPIALAAKETANLPGRVTVIQAKPLGGFPADGAGVRLLRQERSKLL